jgi:small subunit ribosomal protein S4
MARYTGSAYKQARRTGISLLETGRELAKKPFRPGQHGNARRRKVSEYGVQLNEKQKMRFMYGLSEKQFYKFFLKAGKMKGVHGENLFVLLESRLDNIVYRLGLANTRRAARQLVNHGHILLNGHKANIPSMLVSPGDKITLKEKSANHPAMKLAMAGISKRLDFVAWDEKKQEGTYVRHPLRNELSPEIQEALIVEFYNR